MNALLKKAAVEAVRAIWDTSDGPGCRRAVEACEAAGVTIGQIRAQLSEENWAATRAALRAPIEACEDEAEPAAEQLPPLSDHRAYRQPLADEFRAAAVERLAALSPGEEKEGRR